MLKLVLSLLLLLPATHGLAQSYDLSTLPDDYSFVSEGPGEIVTLRLIRREGDRFLFEESAAYKNGEVSTVLVWVNMQSQTISWGEDGTNNRYNPHDCAPALGLCLYTWTDSEGTVDMRTETHLSGDVWISDTYYHDGKDWQFWERECTVYDEYGFWVDFVRIFNDDTSDYGARRRAEPNRLDELWRLCKPSRLTS